MSFPGPTGHENSGGSAGGGHIAHVFHNKPSQQARMNYDDGLFRSPKHCSSAGGVDPFFLFVWPVNMI